MIAYLILLLLEPSFLRNGEVEDKALGNRLFFYGIPLPQPAITTQWWKSLIMTVEMPLLEVMELAFSDVERPMMASRRTMPRIGPAEYSSRTRPWTVDDYSSIDSAVGTLVPPPAAAAEATSVGEDLTSALTLRKRRWRNGKVSWPMMGRLVTAYCSVFVCWPESYLESGMWVVGCEYPRVDVSPN